MDIQSLVVVILILFFVPAIKIIARISFTPASKPPVVNRYDLLEREIARLQAENAQLAIKANKSEYR